jgi:hypothetical protein
MPFKIKIEVNGSAEVEVQGYNVGPAGEEDDSVRRYAYVAKCSSSCIEITSEVTHKREAGIERLAGIILIDISNHKNNPTDAADLLAARIRECG